MTLAPACKGVYCISVSLLFNACSLPNGLRPFLKNKGHGAKHLPVSMNWAVVQVQVPVEHEHPLVRGQVLSGRQLPPALGLCRHTNASQIQCKFHKNFPAHSRGINVMLLTPARMHACPCDIALVKLRRAGTRCRLAAALMHMLHTKEGIRTSIAHQRPCM